MPDYSCFVAFAERGWSQRAETAYYYYVRFAGTECGLSAGAGGAHAGCGHDGGEGGKYRLFFCAAVLLLVYLYLLLYSSAENIFEVSWRNQFYCDVFAVF